MICLIGNNNIPSSTGQLYQLFYFLNILKWMSQLIKMCVTPALIVAFSVFHKQFTVIPEEGSSVCWPSSCGCSRDSLCPGSWGRRWKWPRQTRAVWTVLPPLLACRARSPPSCGCPTSTTGRVAASPTPGNSTAFRVFLSPSQLALVAYGVCFK